MSANIIAVNGRAKSIFDQVEKTIEKFIQVNNNNQEEWRRMVALAKVAKLEKEINAYLAEAVVTKKSTTALQNIQRAKDFILDNIKQSPKMPDAQLQACVRELNDIKALFERKEHSSVVTKDAITSKHLLSMHEELLSQLNLLKDFMRDCFANLLNSRFLNEKEKSSITKLQNQIHDTINAIKKTTEEGLEVRVKHMYIAKDLLEKVLQLVTNRKTNTLNN